jgi:hypothetical protein
LSTHHLQANANLAFNNVLTTAIVTWFLAIDTNHHVMLDLTSMMSSESYIGKYHLHVDYGKGFVISNIAHSQIFLTNCTFTLSNILHVPNVKNL